MSRALTKELILEEIENRQNFTSTHLEKAFISKGFKTDKLISFLKQLVEEKVLEKKGLFYRKPIVSEAFDIIKELEAVGQKDIVTLEIKEIKPSKVTIPSSAPWRSFIKELAEPPKPKSKEELIKLELDLDHNPTNTLINLATQLALQDKKIKNQEKLLYEMYSLLKKYLNE